MILGVHHPALAVPDLERALAFYCGVLGFEPVMEADIPAGVQPLNEAMGIPDGGYQVRMVKKGNSVIEIFEFANAEDDDAKRPVHRNGLTHFALCTDDFQKDYDYLQQSGVEFMAAPFGAAPLRFAYGRDPFGNVFELLEQNDGAPSAVRFD